jgi:hypothetical protein
MKKWFSNRRAHIDEEKVAAKKQAAKDLAALMDSGDEQAYADFVKRLKPDITDDELQLLIEKFHEQRSVHPNDAWPPS